MNTEMLLSDQRFRWISTMYFHVTANTANTTINPFKNLVDFLEVKVGDLFWGTDKDTRHSSKTRFCTDFMEMMQAHGYQVSEQDLHACVHNDEMSNGAMALHLAGAARTV